MRTPLVSILPSAMMYATRFAAGEGKCVVDSRILTVECTHVEQDHCRLPWEARIQYFQVQVSESKHEGVLNSAIQSFQVLRRS